MEFAGAPGARPTTRVRSRAPYEELLPACAWPAKGRCSPTSAEILERLAARPRACSLLLTGNTERGARAKLAHYGLLEFFRRRVLGARRGSSAIAQPRSSTRGGVGCVIRPGRHVRGGRHTARCRLRRGDRCANHRGATGRHTRSRAGGAHPWRTLAGAAAGGDEFLSLLRGAEVPADV